MGQANTSELHVDSFFSVISMSLVQHVYCCMVAHLVRMLLLGSYARHFVKSYQVIVRLTAERISVRL